MNEDTETVELRHTPTIDDIREWGRQNGYTVPESGRLPKGLRKEFMERSGLMPESELDSDVLPARERVQEQAPRVVAERTPVQRARGILNRSKTKSATTRKPKKPRVTTEDIISGLWTGLGYAAKFVSVPASRAFMMEAPAAGMVLDDAIRGTLVDKVLQPFARAEESSKVLGSLLAPPILVGLLDKRPDKADVILPILRKSLVWHIEVAGPKIAASIERERAFEEEYGQQIDAMIMAFFTDPKEQVAE